MHRGNEMHRGERPKGQGSRRLIIRKNKALREVEEREAAFHRTHINVILEGGKLNPPCPSCEAEVICMKEYMAKEDVRRRAAMVCEAKRIADSWLCNVVGCRSTAAFKIMVGGEHQTSSLVLCGEHATKIHDDLAGAVA